MPDAELARGQWMISKQSVLQARDNFLQPINAGSNQVKVLMLSTTAIKSIDFNLGGRPALRRIDGVGLPPSVDEECCICLNKLELRGPPVKYSKKCGHVFHQHCYVRAA